MTGKVNKVYWNRRDATSHLTSWLKIITSYSYNRIPPFTILNVQGKSSVAYDVKRLNAWSRRVSGVGIGGPSEQPLLPPFPLLPCLWKLLFNGEQYTFRDATTKCCSYGRDCKRESYKMYKHLCKPSLATGKTSSRFMIKSIAIFHGCVSHTARCGVVKWNFCHVHEAIVREGCETSVSSSTLYRNIDVFVRSIFVSIYVCPWERTRVKFCTLWSSLR